MIVAIEDQELCIRLQGLERLWALKRELHIPLTHVTSVSIESGTQALVPLNRLVRLPGASFMGLFRAGHYLSIHGWEFWYVSRRQTVVVVELQSEHFARLYLGVDSREAAEAIKQQASR